jgi:hypothetical protein
MHWDEPKYVIYVMVDTPKKSIYGSQVAAPVFAKVASFLARKDGMVPNLISDKNLVAGFDKTRKSKKDTAISIAEGKMMSLRDVLKSPLAKEELEFIGRGSKVELMEAEATDPALEIQSVNGPKKVKVYLRSN